MNRQRNRRSSGKRTFFVKAAAVVIALCLIAALALPAFAAETAEAAAETAEAADDTAAASAESYTYTIRIFPGTGSLPKKGNSDEYTDEPLIISGITPGSSLAQYLSAYDDFRYQKAKASSEKYYPTGIRESGKDNKQSKSDTAGIYTQEVTTSLIVNRDMDLVISYGMKGSEVKYTIQYLEQGTGKELRKAETFYGNEKEKPVVSYLYIEGYVPQYQNVAKTLVKDDSKNVFPFYYVKMEKPVAETETETTTNTTTNSTSGGGTTQQSGGGTTQSGGGTTTTTRTTTTGGTTTRTTTGGTTTTTRTTTTGGTTNAGTATGTNAAGTNAAGTNAAGTNAAGTNAAGTNAAGTNAAGTNAAGTNAAGTTAGTGTAAGTTGTGTAAGTTGTGTGTDANAGTQSANAGTNIPQTTGPQEIVDLDEQQTPLDQFNNGANNTNGTANASAASQTETPTVNPETEGVVRAQGMSTPAKVLLALAVILALGAAGWFFFRRFTMGGDEEEDDEEEDGESGL